MQLYNKDRQNFYLQQIVNVSLQIKDQINTVCHNGRMKWKNTVSVLWYSRQKCMTQVKSWGNIEQSHVVDRKLESYMKLMFSMKESK